MKWFKRWIGKRQFPKALRRVTNEKLASGDINAGTHSRLITASYDKEAMSRLISQTETAPGLHGGIKDWDWEAILRWIQDFFIPLVKTLIPLLLVLDEERK